MFGEDAQNCKIYICVRLVDLETLFMLPLPHLQRPICNFVFQACPIGGARVRQKALWKLISSCSLREHRTFTFMRKTPCCVRQSGEKTGFCFKILQCALLVPPLISSLVIVYLRFEMGEIKFGNSFHSILMNSIRKQKAFVVSSKWVFWSNFPATEVSKVS